ncbi:MAG: hypothetical protein ACLUYK_03820 [Eggerthella lenta]
MKQQVRENGGTVDERTAWAINNFAWGCVDHMTDLAISVPMDDRTAWLARHYRDITSDYEDASVLASCEFARQTIWSPTTNAWRAQADIATKTATEMADLITRAHGNNLPDQCGVEAQSCDKLSCLQKLRDIFPWSDSCLFVGNA